MGSLSLCWEDFLMFQSPLFQGRNFSTGGSTEKGTEIDPTFKPRISLIPPTRSTFPVKVTCQGRSAAKAEKMEVWTS